MRQIIALAELVEPRDNGTWIRAYCPIHGGDSQRSLSINKSSGFGRCHMCKAEVLVQELNPTGADRLVRHEENIAQGKIFVPDPRTIKFEPKDYVPDAWQVQELALLTELHAHFCLRDELVQTYIRERGIGLDTAKAYGLVYFPVVHMPTGSKYAPIRAWKDRILIPLGTPDGGMHYAGRLLKLWKPGMDEATHKTLLDEQPPVDDRIPRKFHRYLKTFTTGWFNYSALQQADGESPFIFVEGAFDALALLDAGIQNVVAVIGTAIKVSWVPKRLNHAIVAFDNDKGGIDAAERECKDLYERGYDVTNVHMPDDGLGKDWSERYRRAGLAGLQPLLDALAALTRESAQTDTTVEISSPIVEALQEHPRLGWRGIHAEHIDMTALDLQLLHEMRATIPGEGSVYDAYVLYAPDHACMRCEAGRHFYRTGNDWNCLLCQMRMVMYSDVRFRWQEVIPTARRRYEHTVREGSVEAFKDLYVTLE